MTQLNIKSKEQKHASIYRIIMINIKREKQKKLK